MPLSTSLTYFSFGLGVLDFAFTVETISGFDEVFTTILLVFGAAKTKTKVLRTKYDLYTTIQVFITIINSF